MLTAEHVSKIYGKGSESFYAVRDASVSLSPGKLTVIVGESGSGKTTLARIMAGIIKADEGSVSLDGKNAAPPARRRDRGICSQIQMVLQDGKSALDPRFTVYRSIAEPVRNILRLPKDEEQKLVYSLMERTELPRGLAGRRPAELSGGQQKRVCIARALATSPKYLIFDEAVSGLDVLLKEKILKLIEDIHRQTGAATLMITHDMDIALYMADRIIVMRDGLIVEDREYSGKSECFTHPYSKLLLRQMDPFA